MKIIVALGALLAVAGFSACAGKQTPAASDTTAAPAAAEAKEAAIGTEEVTYQAGGMELKGFLAYPKDATDKRPGVLIVHEWWGLNDYVRSRAKKLAEQGYVAFALDMYGEGKNTAHPQEAQQFMLEIMGKKDETVQRLAAAREVLTANPRTDPEKLALIGYCMGGGIALGWVRSGADFDLVASFHGPLATEQPLAPESFKGKVMAFTGGADPMIPSEQVAAFKAEMDAAGADYVLVVYPEAKHAFTNPGATAVGEQYGIPLAYDEGADQDSWAKFIEALESVWK